MFLGCYNTGRNDQCECLFDRHADLDRFIMGNHDKNTRGWRQGARDVNPDAGLILLQLLLYFTVGCAGDKADAVNPATGIFDDDHLLETVRPVHEETIRDPFDRLIDAPDKRDLADDALSKTDKPVTQITRRHETANEDEKNRKNHPETGYMKIEKGIGLVMDGNDLEKLVHYIDDKKKDIDRQSRRNDNGKAG